MTRHRWLQRPSAQDVAVGVLFAVAWFGAYAYFRRGDWLPAAPETWVIAGAWSALALTFRTASPLPVLAATAVLYPILYGAPLQTEFHLLPLLIAGYGASVSGRVPLPAVGLLTGLGVVALSYLPAGGLEQVNTSEMLFHLFAAAAVVSLGAMVRHNRAVAAALAERNAELERLRAAEATRAVAEERTRIAGELHDVVAHHLVALIVRAQAAERVATDRPEVAVESMRWIVTTAREALTAVRQTVRVLHDGTTPPTLAPAPSIGDLGAIVERVSATGLDVELRVSDHLPPLDDQVALAAVRITQEALTNTMRHADARNAAVSMVPTDDGVLLQVEDDGVGARVGEPLEPGAGHGIGGMRERAAACGGELVVDVGERGGLRVRAWLPSRRPVPDRG